MKKYNKIAICIFIVVFIITVFLITKSLKAYYVNNGNSFKPVTQEQIDALDACYEPLKDCKENGFDKEKAEELKPIFKKALENGVTVNLYRKSDFCDKINDVSFSDIPIQDGLYDVAVAPVCYDSILAAYLGCVYATEPENLEKELEFLKKGVWILEPVPQFAYFFNYSYDISIGELEVLSNAILSFSEGIESSLDRYKTQLMANYLVAAYMHNTSSAKEISKAKELSENIISYSSKTRQQIEETTLNEVWIGYGENVLVVN